MSHLIYKSYPIEGLSTSQKTVFNTIVLHADTDTNEAWPSNQTLAKETSLCVRSVQNAIQYLLKIKFIRVEFEGYMLPDDKFVKTKRIITILPENWPTEDEKKARKRLNVEDPAILDGSIELVHRG
jgi:hypothetical protein